MSIKKQIHITVQGLKITVVLDQDNDYISLTDMIRAKNGDFYISDWLRNRNTVDFLGIWESIHNPLFNYGEFAIIKTHVGLNSYKLSAKEWIEKTKAVGIKAKTGRYGGTFAHKDIAFEFGMWISPEFKLYLIKEFQRLKNIENEKLASGWDIKRTLVKINYKIHTDAIKEKLIPPLITKVKQTVIYANEADVLNVALYGTTAKEWRDNNPKLEGNIRDYSTVEQLVVLTNLESLNAELIRLELDQPVRLRKLNATAITQMKSLLGNSSTKQLLKIS